MVPLMQAGQRLEDIFAQPLHILQRNGHMSFHGGVEVPQLAARSELGEAGIHVEAGAVGAIKANLVGNQKLLQLDKLPPGYLVVIELKYISMVDLGACSQ